MDFIRRNSKILFVFILPVYLYIVQNSVRNKHTHVYANGIVVTHSHPVSSEDDTPINRHGHSKSEICLYSGLDLNHYDTPFFFETSADLSENHKEYFITDERMGSFYRLVRIIPRGPPA